MNSNDFQSLRSLGQIHIVENATVTSGAPIPVTLMFDQAQGKLFLVDYSSNRYRVATAGAPIGEWVNFSGDLRATG